MTGLIDSHCHLSYPKLAGQLDQVLARAAAAGVDRCVTVGTSIPDIEAALAIADRHESIRVAAGFHPHEAAKITGADLTRLEELLRSPKLVAIGEMGLDYHYDFSDRPSQQRVFESQLAIAEKVALPIVIHCREAHDHTVQTLAAAGMDGKPVVFHCFTGTADQAADIADHGWRLSFTGVVTFKNAQQLQTVAKQYPADQIMIETDAPYLSPMPVRHVRPNEPAFVAHTFRFLAELRNADPHELAAQTAANTTRFYNLT